MNETSSNPAKGPNLPGIVPVGGNPAPGPIEPVNPLIRLAAQFFLIPMAIVIFCVFLIFVFRWLTWEKQDLSTYVSALSSTTRSPSQKEQDALKMLSYIQESKRWQSIYDVTEQLRLNRAKFLQDNPDFPQKVARLFRETAGDDRRVRQYLAQVLGLVGGPEVVPVLAQSLQESDSDTAIHAMVALGRIGDPSCIPALLEASHSPDRGIRQTAVFVLGNFHEISATARCAEAVNDPDLLVQWNAAFGLARQGDARAVPILERFLDQDYVERSTRDYTPTVSPNSEKSTPLSPFHPDRLEQYRATAVRLLGQFPDPHIQKELQSAADGDKQLKVRQAAIEALKMAATK